MSILFRNIFINHLDSEHLLFSLVPAGSYLFSLVRLYVIQIVHKLLKTTLSNTNSHNFRNKYARRKTLQFYILFAKEYSSRYLYLGTL